VDGSQSEVNGVVSSSVLEEDDASSLMMGDDAIILSDNEGLSTQHFLKQTRKESHDKLTPSK
jgi:hypothetical protein